MVNWYLDFIAAEKKQENTTPRALSIALKMTLPYKLYTPGWGNSRKKERKGEERHIIPWQSRQWMGGGPASGEGHTEKHHGQKPSP